MLSTIRSFIRIEGKNANKICSFWKNGQSVVTDQNRFSSFGAQDFYKQEEAFSFADKNALKVYAMETKNAKRLFVAESNKLFWEKYSLLPKDSRHFYEVIRENYLSHLYFDLEFQKEHNSQVQGKELVTVWIEYVNECLWRLFRIRCGRDRVIELDSSTDVKFSQHLIWNIPNVAFKDNSEVGKFVKKICLKLEEYLDEGIGWVDAVRFSGDPYNLIIKSETGKNNLFVDQAVYSKNRQFRLYLSSKLGKDSVLKLSQDCQFNFRKEKNVSLKQEQKKDDIIPTKANVDKTIFFYSLVTNVSKEDTQILVMPEEITFPLNRVEEPEPTKPPIYPISHYPISDQPKNAPHSETPNVSYPEYTPHRKLTGVSYPKYTPHPKTPGISNPNGEFPKGSSLSYKEIENYANQYVRQFKPKAFVRFSREYENTSIILYSVFGSRYCENVGREHKRNQIMIVANYQKQIIYQKCHDPDCEGFKSRFQPFCSFVGNKNIAL